MKSGLSSRRRFGEDIYVDASMCDNNKIASYDPKRTVWGLEYSTSRNDDLSSRSGPRGTTWWLVRDIAVPHSVSDSLRGEGNHELPLLLSFPDE